MLNNIHSMRREYKKSTLKEENLPQIPFQLWQEWFSDALSQEQSPTEPNAMVVSTVDIHGKPHSRVILLKEANEQGFVFFGNYESNKGREIGLNHCVALNFFWPQTERQIRIEGIATKIPSEQSDEYFNSRPFGSKLGAWISKQSEVIVNRDVLDSSLIKWSSEFNENNHPLRPDYWGGYLVKPELIEFWQGGPNRLHDRILYTLTDDKWLITRLSP